MSSEPRQTGMINAADGAFSAAVTLLSFFEFQHLPAERAASGPVAAEAGSRNVSEEASLEEAAGDVAAIEALMLDAGAPAAQGGAPPPAPAACRARSCTSARPGRAGRRR